MPNLAIVIVNYNTRDLLATCLQSVYASRTELSYHVIVVDNVSSDGSAEMVVARFPQATLLKSDRNGGFGYANNLGLRWLAGQKELPIKGSAGTPVSVKGSTHAGQPRNEVPVTGGSPYTYPSDYVLFLNPDTVLPREALQ